MPSAYTIRRPATGEQLDLLRKVETARRAKKITLDELHRQMGISNPLWLKVYRDHALYSMTPLLETTVLIWLKKNEVQTTAEKTVPQPQPQSHGWKKFTVNVFGDLSPIARRLLKRMLIWRESGFTNRELGDMIGVGEKSVRNVLSGNNQFRPNIAKEAMLRFAEDPPKSLPKPVQSSLDLPLPVPKAQRRLANRRSTPVIVERDDKGRIVSKREVPKDDAPIVPPASAHEARLDKIEKNLEGLMALLEKATAPTPAPPAPIPESQPEQQKPVDF